MYVLTIIVIHDATEAAMKNKLNVATGDQINAWIDGQKDCRDGFPEKSHKSNEPDWYKRGYGYEYEMQEILSNINGALQ